MNSVMTLLLGHHVPDRSPVLLLTQFPINIHAMSDQATSGEDLDGARGFRSSLGPTTALVGIWGVSQWVKGLPLSISLFLPYRFKKKKVLSFIHYSMLISAE